MIRVVTLEYQVPEIISNGRAPTTTVFRTKYKDFKKYVAENGQAVCTVSGELVTKGQGNDIYKELINKYEHKIDIRTIEADDSEIYKRLQNCIDPYYFYIDNYDDMKQVQEENTRILEIINAFRKIAHIKEG